MKFEGSCFCKAVKYEYAGELGPLRYCHCANCRKFSGSAFATGSPIQTEQFKVVSGDDVLKEFESSPGVFRAFCGNCACPLYSRRPGTPETLILRVGSLDTKISAKAVAHIFVCDKAEWFEITDGLPEYETRP